MKIEEFIENFAEQFDETEVEEFQCDTEFQALDEWDSMSTLTIIAMIDEMCAITVKAAEIRACETIEDLYNFVNAKL